MGMKGTKVNKAYKNVNAKFNKMTNEKNGQVPEGEIKEHLKFMVAVGLLEEKDGRYKDPEICDTLSDEQREYVMSVSKKSYNYAIKQEGVAQ